MLPGVGGRIGEMLSDASTNVREFAPRVDSKTIDEISRIRLVPWPDSQGGHKFLI